MENSLIDADEPIGTTSANAGERVALTTEQRLFLLLAIVLGVALAASGVTLWRTLQPPVPLVTLTNFEPVGLPPLHDEPWICPGQMLRYRYTMQVHARVVVDMDLTVFRLSPPATVLYTAPRRAIFLEPVTLEVDTSFLTPVTGDMNAYIAQTEWLPGRYLLLMAVTTPTGRTEPAVERFAFNIPQGCNMTKDRDEVTPAPPIHE